MSPDPSFEKRDFLPVGTMLISIAGEVSDVGDREAVQTGANAFGYINEIFPGQESCYGVVFPASDVSVFLSPGELDDAERYRVLSAKRVLADLMPQCEEVNALLRAAAQALNYLPCERVGALIEAILPFQRGGAPKFWSTEDIGDDEENPATTLNAKQHHVALWDFLRNYEASDSDYASLDSWVRTVQQKTTQAKEKP